MPTINEMRRYILDHYPNAGTPFREMIATTSYTRKIVAIYKSIKERSSKDIVKGVGYRQMDMFEYMLSLNERGNTTEVKL